LILVKILPVFWLPLAIFAGPETLEFTGAAEFLEAAFALFAVIFCSTGMRLGTKK